MKKYLATILTLIMIFSAVSVVSPAIAYNDYDTYTDSLGNTYIEGCPIVNGHMEIPAKVGDKVIYGIRYDAFSDISGLKSVTIAEGIKAIESYAFSECENLKTINFPESLEIIRSNAFNGTQWLKEQPEGPVYAGNVLYEYNGEIPANFALKEGATGISDNAFENGAGLVNLIIPKSVTNICADFDYCENLKSIILPKTNRNVVLEDVNDTLSDVYYMGSEQDWMNNISTHTAYSFEIHYNFSSCDIHESTEATEEVAPTFSKHGFTEGIRCTDCGYYVSGHDVIHNNDIIDNYCDICGLEIASISESMTVDGIKYAVLDGEASVIGCDEDALSADVVIPSEIEGNSVKSIANEAFYYCRKMETLTIEEGITGIGDDAFFACKNLETVNLPDGLKAIGRRAFFYCGFEKFDIPYGVEKIGEGALSGNAYLEELVIPGSVKVLEPLFSFQSGSSGVKTLVIENGVEEMMGYCLTHLTQLEKLVIPASVKSIGKEIFINEGRLITDICYNGTQEEWAEIITDFEADYPEKQIHYDYCTDHGNTEEREGAAPSENGHGYTSGVFCTDCDWWVSGHNAVHYDGGKIDGQCDICMMGAGTPTVETDRYRALVYDGKAAIIKIKSCDANGELIIPSEIEGATVVALNAMCCDVEEITSLVVPDSVTYIGNYAFNDNSLEKVVIGDGVEYIGEEAFSYCYALREVTLGAGLKTIERYAFEDSYNIKDVFYNGTQSQWEQINIGNGNGDLLNATISFLVEDSSEPSDQAPTQTPSDEKDETTKPTTPEKTEPTTVLPAATIAPVVTAPSTTKAPAAVTTEKEKPAEKAKKPGKVKIKKPSSKKKKQIAVSWNIVKDANGYQIAYSTSKKFTKKISMTKLIKKAKTTKTTLKKLKSGKKYFIKIRAYKTVNGKKLYGAYSKVMNVKVR